MIVVFISYLLRLLSSSTRRPQGTVLLKSAEELKAFSKGEEELLEAQIKEIHGLGIKVVVSGTFLAHSIFHLSVLCIFLNIYSHVLVYSFIHSYLFASLYIYFPAYYCLPLHILGSKFGDLALHFLNRYGIMAVRLTSKHDLRRLCQTIHATALPRVVAPTSKDIGHVDEVVVDEV